jgi:hypothetical protein
MEYEILLLCNLLGIIIVILIIIYHFIGIFPLFHVLTISEVEREKDEKK